MPCFNPSKTGRLVLNLPILQGWKAELTLVLVGWLYIEMVYQSADSQRFSSNHLIET